MFRKAMLALSVAALLAPVLAHAGDAKDRGITENVYLYGQNAPLPLEGFNVGVGILGVGYRLNLPIKGSHWGWTGAIEYGKGMNKDENTVKATGVTTTSELDATQLGILVGMNYFADCCDNDDWYCGPGLYYSNTEITTKLTGSPDRKLGGIKTYGLEAHVGGALPIGPKMRLFGESSSVLGMNSWDQDRSTSPTKDKVSSWTTFQTWRGGLRIKW